jgi:thymidylate synthase
MGEADRKYQELLGDLLRHGELLRTRNANVRRLFGLRVEFASTPLVCARRTAWKTALRELEWFLSGSDNVNDLHPSVRHWWAPWADATGRVQHNYGHELRHSGSGFDQVEYLLNGIRHHPNSRRNLVATWDTENAAHPDTPITNCHLSLLQAFVDAGNRLHFVTYQRSADVVCGLPHNWVQAWALLLWAARRTGRLPGTLVWVGGDVHLYDEHAELARQVLGQNPEPGPELLCHTLGKAFRADDFRLSGEYRPALEDRARMVV